MKPLLLKLASFLIPAGVALGFLLWWFSPSQSVIRSCKAVFDALEISPISIGTKAELSDRFESLLASEVEITAAPTLQPDSYSREEIRDIHREFQDYVISSHIEASDYKVEFPSPNVADLTADAQAEVKLLGGGLESSSYRISFRFEKAGKTWLLSKIQADER